MAETVIEQILVRFGVDTTALRNGFSQAQGSSGNLLKSFASLMGVTLSVGTAISATSRFVRSSVDDYTTLARRVQDLSRDTGMAAEETSTLIQVFDDLGVDIDSVSGALQYAQRNGFNPTLENLMALSDEYNAIQDPLQRSQLLFETFGRSGEQMGRILATDRDTLAQLAEQVQGTALIIDEEGVRAYENYRVALDGVSDKWEALKLQLAEDIFLPVVTSILDQINAMDLAQQYYEDTSTDIFELAQDWETYATAAAWAYDANGILSGSMVSLDQLAEQGIIMSEEQYNAHMAARDAILAEADAMTTYSDTSGAYIGTLETITDSFGELTAAQIYNRAAQNMDSEAALALARDMGLLNEQSYAAYSALDLLNQQLADGAISADEYEYAASNLALAIASLQDKGVTITVDIIQRYTDIYGWASTGGATEQEAAARVFHWGGTNSEPLAAGGDMQAFMPYWVGEEGPELVVPTQSGTVIPADQSARMASGSGGASAREIGMETALALQRLGLV